MYDEKDRPYLDCINNVAHGMLGCDLTSELDKALMSFLCYSWALPPLRGSGWIESNVPAQHEFEIPS